MAQTSSNVSSVKWIPQFWQNHSIDPPTPWEDRRDLFQLAVVAKANIDIELLLIAVGRTLPALQNAPEGNESEELKNSRTRNLAEQIFFNDEEAASKKAEPKQFNRLMQEDADKKLRSILSYPSEQKLREFLAISSWKLKSYISLKKFSDYLFCSFCQIDKLNV